MDLTATTTIRRPRSEVYAFWHQFENLSTFMAHLDDVRSTGDGRSHWRSNRSVRQDRRVGRRDRRGRPRRADRLALRRGGRRPATGARSSSCRAPGGRGTEVHVVMAYDLPGGELGKAVAKYFGEEPNQQLDDDLRRLKQVMETGEVVRSDGAPYGKQARAEFPQRPAQPLSRRGAQGGAPS